MWPVIGSDIQKWGSVPLRKLVLARSAFDPEDVQIHYQPGVWKRVCVYERGRGREREGDGRTVRGKERGNTYHSPQTQKRSKTPDRTGSEKHRNITTLTRSTFCFSGMFLLWTWSSLFFLWMRYRLSAARRSPPSAPLTAPQPPPPHRWAAPGQWRADGRLWSVCSPQQLQCQPLSRAPDR